MPDRAIIPLLPALALGFICGIVVATLQLEDTPTLLVGLVGSIAVILAGVSSVFGVRGDKGEKTIVAALRAGCAVALYGCMFLFILGFLREGEATALVWLVLGIVIAIVLTQLRVRDHGEPETASDA